MNINVATDISKEHKNIEVIIKAPEMTEEVQQITNTVMKVINSRKQIIASKENKMYILDIKEIIKFYSEDKSNYCNTEKGIFKIKERLYELEEILGKNFIRISNSCIINLNHVESFDSSITGTIEVIFKDKTKEYVSRRRVSDVMKKIREWRG